MVVKQKTFKIKSYGRSDIGLVRENNEDAWLADPENNIYVLCDGMGGHTAGEVAAQEAVAVFSSLSKKRINGKSKSSAVDESQLLRQLIKDVNSAIYTLSRKDSELRGMGTTLCCVYFNKSRMAVGHVGDSRVYLFREKSLSLLTEDHSLVAELLELGELNPRQARDCSYRNIITKAIGAEQEVNPTVQVCDLVAGDQIMMCSDGLSDLVPTEEIERIISTSRSISTSVDQLIVAAKSRGGLDNITVVLMRVA